MKASQILCIIIAIALLIFGFVYPLPTKRVETSSRYSAYDSGWGENIGAEYVGGDCYNYQIEASLKAGYFTGILTMKSISVLGGLILFFLALFSKLQCDNAQRKIDYLKIMADKLSAEVITNEEQEVKPETETLNDSSCL